MQNKSKGLYFLTLMLGLAFVVVACTPKAQQQATDVLTNDAAGQTIEGDSTEHEGESMDDDGTSLKVPAPGFDPDSVDEMIVEDNEAMEDDEKLKVTNEIKTFNVDGVNFAFSTKEIRVKKGDTVTINFTSNGGLHDWTVNEFSARTERVNSGASSSVTFVADKAGTFEYYCSVGTHRQLGMVGSLIVE